MCIRDSSRREEFLLSGIIEKCLGENPKKKYHSLKEVQKELPKVSSIKNKEQKKQQRKTVLIAAVIVLLLTAVWAGKALAYTGNTEEITLDTMEETAYI